MGPSESPPNFSQKQAAIVSRRRQPTACPRTRRCLLKGCEKRYLSLAKIKNVIEMNTIRTDHVIGYMDEFQGLSEFWRTTRLRLPRKRRTSVSSGGTMNRNIARRYNRTVVVRRTAVFEWSRSAMLLKPFGERDRNQRAINQKTVRRRRVARGCSRMLCRCKERPCKSPYSVPNMGVRTGAGVLLNL